MLCKSSIQCSVNGWGCVSSLLFNLGPTMVEVMKIMVTSFKRPHAPTATLSAPDPAAGHRRPPPPPETPAHSRAHLGQSPVGSRLLSPGSRCTRFCLASKSLFPQSCVSSGSSMGGLMAISSKRTSSILPTTVGRNPLEEMESPS